MKGSLEDIAVREAKLFLKTVSEGLKALAKGVESLASQVDGMSEAPKSKPKPEPEAAAARTAKPKPSKKAAKVKTRKKPAATAKQKTTRQNADKPAPATEIILELISREQTGATTPSLSEKTGFSTKKIHNVVYRLKKQGKIKTIRKGVYAKA